jgi:hypothetical protein
MRSRWMGVVAAILSATSGLVTPVADAAIPAADAAALPADGPSSNGMLAFFSWAGSAGHISDPLDLMVVNPDGSNPQTLVPDAVERSLCGFGLTWSPDGNQIAYVSNDGLWMVDADGSNNRKIAQVCASEINWSPTGEWLALTVPNLSGVLLVHPDGTGSRFINTCFGGGSDGTFSPDGDLIALVGGAPCDASQWGIYVYDVATGDFINTVAVTQGRGMFTDYTASDLAWSPDGSTILTWFQDLIQAGSCHALGQTGQYSTSDLWTAAANGSGPLVRVGSTTGEYDWKEWDPDWSPDGQKFAFAATRNTGCTTSATYVPLGYESLWTMNTDGTERQEIYVPPLGALTAVIDVDWQPCTATTTSCHLEPPVDPGGGDPGGGDPGGGDPGGGDPGGGDPGGGDPGGGDPGHLTSVVPARLLESRPGEDTVDGLFEGIGRRGAGSVTELPVTGRGGVPGDAAAVMLNVAAVFPDAPGYLVVYPCGSPRPVASNVNYGPGDVVPNAVLAKVGVDGKVCIYTLAGTDIIADVNGYVR